MMDTYMPKAEPRILVISVAAWNSKIGQNTWQSLLSDYAREKVAHLYIRDDLPDSLVASRYFSISENRVLKSVFKPGIRTGREIAVQSVKDASADSIDAQSVADLNTHNNRYARMQKHRSQLMLMAREVAWKLGKWKSAELDEFIDSFKPELVLYSMEAKIHLADITEYVIDRTGAKAIGYFWDDNFTYKQSSNPGYKVYRFFQRRSLKRLTGKMQGFFAISKKTKEEADATFGIDCSILTKPLSRLPEASEAGEEGGLGDEHPIRLIYTGNLLVQRDDSLLLLDQVLAESPELKGKIAVDIYCTKVLEPKKLEGLRSGTVYIKEPVPQPEVLKLQQQADVMLYLESIGGSGARAARLSFSTKITDYLSSGKCIFAIGDRNIAAMEYLIGEDIAVVADSYDGIKEALLKLVNDKALTKEYAARAASAAIANHSPEKINAIFRGKIDEIIVGSL